MGFPFPYMGLLALPDDKSYIVSLEGDRDSSALGAPEGVWREFTGFGFH